MALALTDVDGRLLLQQRLPGKHHGGLWEFPGGKVEYGENPRFSLAREMTEELGLVLDPAAFKPSLLADEGHEKAVVLFLYTAVYVIGEVAGLEGQNWGWFTLADATALPLAPMDRDLLERLPS